MSMFQSDMNNEFKRYATFSGFRCPEGTWPTQLARCGFYRSADCADFQVECFACGLKLDLRTIKGQQVAEVHRRHAPDCSFVAGSSNNQPVPPVDSVASLEWLQQNFSLDSFRGSDACDVPQVSSPMSSPPGSADSGYGYESSSEPLSEMPDMTVLSQLMSSHLPSLSNLNTLEMNETDALPSLPMDLLSGFASATLDSVPTRQLFGSSRGGPQDILVTDGEGVEEIGHYPATGMLESEAETFNNRSQQQQQQQHEAQFHSLQPGVDNTNNTNSLQMEAESDLPAQKLTLGDLGIITQRPKWPGLATMQSRLATFSNWCGPQISQTSEDIAAAGFYYAGSADLCRCFYCGGGLKSWEKDDDPWIEHARWFQKCPFILTNKGSDFVNAVQSLARTTNNNSIRQCDVDQEIQFMRSQHLHNSSNGNLGALLPETEMEMETLVDDVVEEEFDAAAYEAEQRENYLLREPNLCKICLEAEVSVIYLPCAHLVTCGKCAPTVRNCPICRKEVGGQVLIQRD